MPESSYFGAVLWFIVISATFFRNYSGFWAGFGSCFGDFCSFSYFFSQLFRLLGWFWELFWEFLQFQLIFSRIFRLLGWILGAVLKDLGITAPQGLPSMIPINETLIPESVPTECDLTINYKSILGDDVAAYIRRLISRQVNGREKACK